MMWVLSRASSQNGQQKVPPWAGWLGIPYRRQQRRKEDPQQSIVDYMAPVFFPITESTTVQHLLVLSQEASREVGQEYTIVTFDLAVAKKAYSLVWQQPLFDDTIMRMGGFHLVCSYMAALGKKMRCSGFEEIVIESGEFVLVAHLKRC